MTSRLSWFLTPTGRKFSFGFMTAASITAFALEYCPHTFLLFKYKEVVSMYESAMPAPLSDRVVKVWNETLADLSLPEHEVRYLEPFTVFGFDVFHAGSVTSRHGAIIGLPINFTYTDVSSVNPTLIRVNNETVNWNRQDAKKLLDALVLSEDAQRYGIAREILMTRYNTPLISGVIGSFMVSSTYLLCRRMNDSFKLLQRPLLVRGCFYFLGCLFSFGIWTMQIDLYNVYREKETDSYIAQLGDRYANGAIEFYGKMLQRNVALRSLLGEQGETVYSSTGHEKFLFRQPRLPIEKRKAFFENTLAGLRREKGLIDEDVFQHTT